MREAGRVSCRELQEWEAFRLIEPSDADRIERMLGELCALLANVNRSKITKAFAAKDFIPDYQAHIEKWLRTGGTPDKLTGEQLALKCRLLNALHGGTELSRPGSTLPQN